MIKNKKMKLEDAIKICRLLCGKKNKKGKREYKTFARMQMQVDYTIDQMAEAIETVLQELEDTQKNYELSTKQNISYKQNIHDLKYNSIPKKKIEDKIKEYMEYDKKVKTYTSDGRENFTMEYFYAKNLQELLEDK